MACRMVCELDGHSNHRLWASHDGDSSCARRNHQVRKLFWLCYMSDKNISLFSGKPPILGNEYCDLSTPERFVGHGAFLQESNEAMDLCSIAVEKLTPFFWGDPLLSLLKEKIFRLLYSPSALLIMDNELLSRIRLLDDELEDWRLSMPHELRPRLPSLQNDHLLRLRSTQRFSGYLRSIQLQLEYHYIINAIHTPVRRLGATQSETTIIPDDLHSVMHSSIDLSLEASRSTLHILNQPITGNALW